MRDYIEVIQTDGEGQVRGVYSDRGPVDPQPMSRQVDLVRQVAADGVYLSEERLNALEGVTRGLPNHVDAYLGALARVRVDRVARLSAAVDNIEEVMFSDEMIRHASISQLIKIHQQAGIALEDSIKYLKDVTSKRDELERFSMLVDARSVHVGSDESGQEVISPAGREKLRSLFGRISESLSEQNGGGDGAVSAEESDRG